ncbi:glycosyltransferase [Niveibacterium sp.]|uniref:glycosyltransferase n=1 Tax=Niveibacterium sp. TaxID=2017444 RepID=UPI0035B1FC2B
MILVTVGTQLAFDRLVGAVDEWASKQRGVEVFAQVGPSRMRFDHLQTRAFVPPDEANDLFQRADLIVSHAGMGSILTALKYRKPILIMPRKAGLGEHRNDHQLATAKWLGTRPGVTVAWEASDVARLIDARSELQSGGGIPDFASAELIDRLKSFISSC